MKMLKPSAQTITLKSLHVSIKLTIMVLQFLIQNSIYAYRERDSSQKARVCTAAAFLTSLIADADVVTDWVYFFEIISRGNDDGEDIIPNWIQVFQLVSCICGTISWIAISSDGRFMEWCRKTTWWSIWASFYIIKIILYVIPDLMIRCFSCGRFEIDDCWIDFDKTFDGLLVEVKTYFTDGFRISSGGLLMVGIITEDLPQIIVTFLVEDAIGALGNNKGISNSAYLNLVLAIFDILHKLAAAWDDRNLYIGTGTGAQTLYGHTKSVHSLVRVGLNKIVSVSTDGRARLWDTVKGRIIKTFELGERSWHGTVVKAGDDKIVTVSNNLHGQIKTFNVESGECIKTIFSGSNAKCTVGSENGIFFLTSKQGDTDEITRWDTITLEPIQRYPKRADHLIILNNDQQFVSVSNSFGEDDNPTLWDMTTGNQIQHFNTKNKNRHIVAMCNHGTNSFLLAYWHGADTHIELFTIDQSEPTETMTMEGTHIDSPITSVSGYQFATCHEDCSVALWDLSTGTRLCTYEGHTSWINDIVYLREKRSIVTVSNDHTMKMWPISIHFEVEDSSDQEISYKTDVEDSL